MRFALLTILSFIAIQTTAAVAQELVNAPFVPRRPQSSQKRSSATIVNGRQLQIGEEKSQIEISLRTGRMIHAGKTREFRSIVGLQPVTASQRWIAPLTDDLVIQQFPGFKEYVLPCNKIAKITVGKVEKGNLSPLLQVTTRAGKSETFGGTWHFNFAVEIEWVDSIARERFSLGGIEGAVIELYEQKGAEKEEPK